MVTLKVLKSRLDSSNVFYGVLRVVKMTSMAKFNEITKHAKVRDLSLRVPVRILCNYTRVDTPSSLFWGIMTNSGKCGAINVNVMESISNLLSSSSKTITYGKKGFSLCSRFGGYIHTIFEAGSTSNRNLVISGRILSSACHIDMDHTIIYNRYYGMTSRAVSFYNVGSYENFAHYCATFIKSSEVRSKVLSVFSSGDLVNLYDFLLSNILLNALYENDLSECSARIQSLETALKNLEMIIEDLRKVYNKRRQGSITNELLEIIASTISI